MEWEKIKHEYVTTDTSQRKLASKYGVSATAIAAKCKSENWVEQREQYRSKTYAKKLEASAKAQVRREKRLQAAADKLMDKLERAIDELDLYTAKNTVKTKVIEYNHELRPDKPTKEIVEEHEEICEVRSIIDKLGIKAIASALGEIKDIHMIQSERDIREQEARIAKLERESGTVEPEIEDNAYVSAELFPDETPHT